MEENQTANVTLKDVNIDVSGNKTAAVSTSGESNVTIEPEGESTIKSGHHHADLEKNNGGTNGAGIGGGIMGRRRGR